MVTIAAVGGVLAFLFQALSPLIGDALPSGLPAYDLEIWLANATLGVTFPFLVLNAEFFDFWPFGVVQRVQRQTA